MGILAFSGKIRQDHASVGNPPVINNEETLCFSLYMRLFQYFSVHVFFTTYSWDHGAILKLIHLLIYVHE